MIHLHTSALIHATTGPTRSEPRLRHLINGGERLVMSALVVYEWRRGPRSPEEIADQASLFPIAEAIPFGPAEAFLAAELYRQVKRPRGRELAIPIAACAIAREAQLWTLHPDDFKDIPKLKLL